LEKKKRNKEEERELFGLKLKVKKELNGYSDEALEEFLESNWICGC